MADTNPIHYSDLIAPDNSIENLIKQLGQLQITYEHLVDTVKASSLKLAASMKSVSGATSEGRKKIAESSKEADKLAQAHEKLKFAQSETAKQIAELNRLTQQQNARNKENAKIALSQRDSYDRLSARYAQLKREINNMRPTNEKELKAFEAKQKACKQLYDRMNELQKATGKYTLQVGNYTIAADSMRQAIKQGKDALVEMEAAGQKNTAAYQEMAQKIAALQDQMSDTNQMIKNMASDTSNLDAVLQGLAVGTGGFAAATGAMELFGGESKDVEEAQRKLQAAIALVNGVTSIQNALQKQSALVTKLKALQTAILSKFQRENTATTVANTTAIKAQGVATETTTKATKGLGKALNALKSNPVILALSALVALGVGVVAVVKKVRAAQKEAYEEELANLEATEAKRKVAMAEHETAISQYQQEIKLAQAEGKSEQEIFDLRAKELQERSDMAVRSTAWNKQEIANLDANKKKLLENQATLKAADAEQIKLKKYKREEIEAENALLERQIEIAEKQLETNKELEVEFLAMAKERKQLAIDTAKADEDSFRQLQDARFSLIKNQFNRERAQTKAQFDRQKADLETELQNNVNLTVKQRENMNALIIELENQKQDALKKINESEQATNKAAIEATENMRLALMQDGADKQAAQLLTNYNRQTAAIQEQLAKESELTLTQKEELNKQLILLEKQYNKEVADLQTQRLTDSLNQELKAIELRKAAAVKGQTDLTSDTLREIEIRRQLELSANAKLADELKQDEKAINAKYDMERKQTEDNLRTEIANRQLDIQQNLAKSEIDIMQTSEKKKTTLRLQLEKERLEKVLALNEQANIKMSEEERKTIENQIAKINQDIKKNEQPNDLYDVLGLNLTDEQKGAFNDSLQYAKDALTSFIDFKLQVAQRNIEIANQEVDAANEALNAERQARAAGYANNVAMAEKELAAAKAQQRKALKQQEDAQRAQQRIQTVEQAVNMTTATAKIFGQFGFYGIPLIALMWGAFAASKIKAMQLKQEQYGDGTVELLQGGSHQSGNDIDLGTKKDGTKRRAEGGEFFAVINKRMSRKYRKEIPQIINSLNRGDFAQKYASAYDGGMAVIATFDGKAELTSIAKDMREINERDKSAKVVYTADGRIEKRGNVTRIIKN